MSVKNIHLKKMSVVVTQIILLVLLPALYYGIAQYKFNGGYSIFDEITHMSYTWSVSHGDLPAKGDSDVPQALNDWSCSGQYQVPLPACDSGTAAQNYPNLGQQYNYFHPPLYYFITGMISRLIVHLFPVLSFFRTARALSVVWMILGCLALYRALKAWKINDFFALSAAALVPYIPVFLNSGTAVTNDAPALLCGAGALFVSSQIFVEHKPFLWQTLLIILSCSLVKGTFVFPFLALAAVLILYSMYDFLHQESTKACPEALQGCLIGFVALLSVYAFQILQAFRGDASAVSAVSGQNTDKPQGSPIGEFLNTVMSWMNLGTVGDSLRQGMGSSVGYSVWIAVLSIVVSGSAAFLYFQNDGTDSHAKLCAFTVFGLLLYPSLVQVREYINSGELFGQITGRYGLTFLPLVLCCWSLALQRKKSYFVAVVVLLLGIVASFISVISMPRFYM